MEHPHRGGVVSTGRGHSRQIQEILRAADCHRLMDPVASVAVSAAAVVVASSEAAGGC
jgi:hypothetical protein